MKKFVLLTTLLVLTRVADIYTTYLSTPDLKTEANPLVSKFGLGWTGLLIAQVILLPFYYLYTLGLLFQDSASSIY